MDSLCTFFCDEGDPTTAICGLSNKYCDEQDYMQCKIYSNNYALKNYLVNEALKNSYYENAIILKFY